MMINLEKEMTKVGELVTNHNVAVAKELYQFNTKLVEGYLQLGKSVAEMFTLKK